MIRRSEHDRERLQRPSPLGQREQGVSTEGVGAPKQVAGKSGGVRSAGTSSGSV